MVETHKPKKKKTKSEPVNKVWQASATLFGLGLKLRAEWTETVFQFPHPSQHQRSLSHVLHVCHDSSAKFVTF